MTTRNEIPDIQGLPDARNVAIDRVGIKALRRPVRVAARGGEVQHSVGVFSTYVGLSPERKGTHMSRFVEILEQASEPLSWSELANLLQTVQTRLGATRAELTATFDYFVRKAAPVSGVVSTMDYRVTLAGVREGQRNEVTLDVEVPVKTLCPCSKEISDFGAHNQRANVAVRVTPADASLWIDDIIAAVEAEASSPLYALLKRPDEKHVTEAAYANPKFVEDLVRDVAIRLRGDRRIARFHVRVENIESIHNHSAYAEIESA